MNSMEVLCKLSHPAWKYTSQAYPDKQPAHTMKATVNGITHRVVYGIIKPLLLLTNIKIGQYSIEGPLICNYSNQLAQLGELHSGDCVQFSARLINDSAQTESGYKITYMMNPHLCNHRYTKRLVMPTNDETPRAFSGYICLKCHLKGHQVLVKNYQRWRKNHTKLISHK